LKNGINAAVFLIAGLFVIAVGIPVTYSGVGAWMRGDIYCSSCQTSPKGTFFVLDVWGGYILLEPAFFIGVALLVIGVFFLRQSIKSLGIRTDKKPVTPIGMRQA
jgi:hypothetical protein